MTSNFQRLQNGHQVPRMSRNQRIKKQCVHFLGHLQKMGVLTTGIEKKKFMVICDTLFKSMDPRFRNYFIFQYLLGKRFFLRINKATPDILHFNVAKIERFLLRNVVDSMSQLTLQPGPSKPATTAASNGVKSQKPRRTAPPLIVNQRQAFRLNEKVVKLSTLGDNVDFSTCTSCNKKFLTEELKKHHEKTDQHLFLAKYQVSKSLKGNDDPKELLGFAEGIIIQSTEGNEDRHTLQVTLTKTDDSLNKKINLKITYDVPEDKHRSLFLDYVFLVFGNPNECVMDSYNFRQEVPKENPLTRMITIKGDEVGRTEYVVVFKFVWENEDREYSDPFFVLKRISVRVDTEITKEEGIPVFSRAKVEFVLDIGNQKSGLGSDYIVVGTPSVLEEAEPPSKPVRQLKYVIPLEEYAMPHIYRSFFNCGFQGNEKITMDHLMTKYRILSNLVDGLQKKNHTEFLAIMLYFEEHQTLYDLRSYSLKDTPIVKSTFKRNLIAIEVPGLAEQRPSVLKRDGIFVTVPGVGLFKGWVHHVGNTQIHVGLGPKFMNHFVDKMNVTVDFSFNRFCLKTEHRALELIKSSKHMSQICYPTTCGKYLKNKPIAPGNWVNAQVKTNPEQAQAVQNILNGTSLPAPYLVFGPPGTGKTVTLVETIKQIFFNSETDRVLGTAPSNNAADLLAKRVLESLPASQVLRLYSPSRNWSSVPENLKTCSNYYQEECVFPSLEELMKYRVIICTLICAGRLVGGGFPSGHFTHIFIDECGHGMEPTALVPVAGLLSPEPNPGQLVLSGDCHQLGYVIRSPVAKQLGLGQSLLGRLMTLDMYKKQDGKYNSQVLTKLVRNFRSHPAILKVPNELFYDGDLKACGNEVIFSACDWDGLPTKGMPIIFHGVEGKDEQDEGSPSFFNIAEVNLVVTYVQKILDSKFCGQKLRPNDIGVISPYRRQILKLHRALERSKIPGVNGVDVGSVEEFQGQERRVIIISTVRSNPSKLALDRTFRLGFVREPKRFNVAITRAKALLIVIGNPNILQLDPNWRRLLEWSIEKGGYTGCRFKLCPQNDLLAPIDPDQFRVPVQNKLQKQLECVTEVLKRKQNPGVDDAELSKLIQQSGLFSAAKVSELQSDVSPPFTSHEQ